MSFGRKRVIFGISAAIAAATASFPMATGFAFESDELATAEADAELLADAGLADPMAAAGAEPTIALDEGGDELISIEEAAAMSQAIIEDAEAANEEFVEETAVNDARDDELVCLAKAVLHESRGEPRQGQLAVAQVIMNRVESPRFPNSICGVIYQPRQFSNIRSFTPRRSGAMWERAVEIAIDARNDVSDPVVGEALYFHAARIRPAFTNRLSRVARIGNHIFYR